MLTSQLVYSNIFTLFAGIYLTQVLMLIPIAIIANKKRTYLLFALSTLISLTAFMWSMMISNYPSPYSSYWVLGIEINYCVYIAVYVATIVMFTTNRFDWVAKLVIGYFLTMAVFRLGNEFMEFSTGHNLLWNYVGAYKLNPEKFRLFDILQKSTDINFTLFITDFLMLAIFMLHYLNRGYTNRDRIHCLWYDLNPYWHRLYAYRSHI